jgi:hypothetical protein
LNYELAAHLCVIIHGPNPCEGAVPATVGSVEERLNSLAKDFPRYGQAELLKAVPAEAVEIESYHGSVAPQRLMNGLTRLQSSRCPPAVRVVEPKARETVTDYARSWLSTRLARGDWRETTARRYMECLELHVLPRFGAAFIDALTPRDVERALGEWAEAYQRATVNSWLRVLRTMLNDAVASAVIATNPAAHVRALRERRDDDGDEDDWANALAPVELDPYLRGWRELYPEHFALIATLVLTGLRWGEATALKWEDVEAAE